ncbi:Cathepsin L-like protease [Leptomonas seymouri]|uniref:Cathepsin L-like protease n=1 Tax=Leptomonas seymouri TaxID=5684 RepID=A0A0N1IHT6_LEPSE|nr:Cathepsin L-like protease [Leptomonas seymouri]|eukprot:KPI84111.1 Cathepsin L-like protease [Leptomonas seymouri]
MMVEETIYKHYQCKVVTKKTLIPVDECRRGEGGDSVMLQCGLDQVIERRYTTGDCSGVPQYVVTPTNTCIVQWWGSLSRVCRES